MSRTVKPVLLLVGFLALTLGVQAPAYATPILLLSDGSTTVTVADGGLGDGAPLPGMVMFNGALGSWAVNVSTGITKPVLGSAVVPWIDLNSVDVNLAGGGGSLLIAFTETDFTLNNWLSFDVGGVLSSGQGSSASFAAFADPANTPFGTGSLLGSFSFPNGAFSGSTSAPGPATSPYSLTLAGLLDFTTAGSASFNSQVTVPEPGTLVLFGTGLVGLVGLARRRGIRFDH